MWPGNVAALAWTPWLTLVAEKAWREGGRQVAVAALTGAMQMLTGAPEIILLTWLFVGVLWLGQFVLGTIPRGRMSGRVAAAGLLVAGLAAAQLLPFLDLLAHSHRDTGFGGSLGWAMPLSGPANFLVPLFHCFSSGHGVFVQYDQYWVSSHYLGAGLMALAVAGSWGARNRRVWLLLAVAELSVIMAAVGLHPVSHQVRGAGRAGHSDPGGVRSELASGGGGQFHARTKGHSERHAATAGLDGPNCLGGLGVSDGQR